MKPPNCLTRDHCFRSKRFTLHSLNGPLTIEAKLSYEAQAPRARSQPYRMGRVCHDSFGQLATEFVNRRRSATHYESAGLNTDAQGLPKHSILLIEPPGRLNARLNFVPGIGERFGVH